MDISAINGYYGTYMTVERSASGTSLDGVSFDEVFKAVSCDDSDVTIDSTSSGPVTKYDSIFEKAAETYHLPVSLLKAVAKQESGFDPSAVSSSGAMGIMQLMPETARELGVDDPFDPEENIMGGARYLASMMKRYDNDISLALAAYNAGAGNVDKYGGIPPFTETKQYVKKVLKYAESYGLDSGTEASSDTTKTASSGASVSKASSGSSGESVSNQYLEWMNQMAMQSQWMTLMSMNQSV